MPEASVAQARAAAAETKGWWGGSTSASPGRRGWGSPSIVATAPDPADGRARQLHLTPRGRAAVAAARRCHADFERRLAGEAGSDQVAAVRAVLAGYLDRAGAETELARILRPL